MAKKKLNAWQKLFKAKLDYCNGNINKVKLNRAADAYRKDALKKGKSKSKVDRSIEKLLGRSCPTR